MVSDVGLFAVVTGLGGWSSLTLTGWIARAQQEAWVRIRCPCPLIAWWTVWSPQTAARVPRHYPRLG
jgi:hypothetical protein